MTSSLFFDSIETPIGRFAIVADEHGALHAAGFMQEHGRMERQLESYARAGIPLLPLANPSGIGRAVARYFAGDLSALDRLSLATRGTGFQRAVWQALREIPCGETWSYARLARHVGRPAAMRAVGLANGANPVCLIVPCHRVIGSNGALTGYGAGIERKRWLLAHEHVACPNAAIPTRPHHSSWHHDSRALGI